MRLQRGQLPVVFASAAILAIGAFVTTNMPDPKEVGYEDFVYDQEIPKHARLDDVNITTTKLPDGSAAPFPDSPGVYEVTADFNLTLSKPFSYDFRIITDDDVYYRGSGLKCDSTTLGLPQHCTAKFVVPEQAVGPADFQFNAQVTLSQGLHEQPVPMRKVARVPVELKP